LEDAGKHRIVVGNPAPGGGNSQTLVYTIAPHGRPQFRLANSLSKDAHSRWADVITLKNVGVSTIKEIKVSSVTLEKGDMARSPWSGVRGSPPAPTPSGRNSLIVTFPSNIGKPGQVATVRVKGTADGKVFNLSQNVRLP